MLLVGKYLPTKSKNSHWVYTIPASKVYAFRKMCLKMQDYKASHCVPAHPTPVPCLPSPQETQQILSPGSAVGGVSLPLVEFLSL